MTFWSGETLAQTLPALVQPFDVRRIDCASYRLCIGPEIYVSPSGEGDNPTTQTKVQLAAEQGFTIPPGQFGFLVTEETIKVPADAIGFISIRAKVKSRGLVNVSGFHADPGYHGRLVFAVFNAGPAPVHLARGEECFLIWFANLDHQSDYVKSGEGYQGIPSDLINPIAGEVQSFAGLLGKINSTEKELDRRLTKVERDNTIIRWGVTILVGVFVAWASREYLPSRSAPPVPVATSPTVAPLPDRSAR